MRRGEIWWVRLREPIGSEPGYPHPGLIVSSDGMNESKISTVLIAVLTSNLRLQAAIGNVFVSAAESGLDEDSVVNVSQLVTADKGFLSEKVGALEASVMLKVEAGLRRVMDL